MDGVEYTVEPVHDTLFAVYADANGVRFAMNVESDDDATIAAAKAELDQRITAHFTVAE